MTWLRIDDQFPYHRKVAPLSDAAWRLHVTAMADCCAQLTDGLVSEDTPGRLVGAPRKDRLCRCIRALESAGLWEKVEGGWRIHDFLHWNPSAETVKAKRTAARERMRKARVGRSREVPANCARSSPNPVPVPNTHTDQVDPDLLEGEDRPEVRSFQGQFAESEQAKTLERALARRERNAKRTRDGIRKRRGAK